MKRIKIKNLCLLSALVVSLASCGKENTPVEVTLDPKDFSSGKQIITLADLPPNPTDDDAIDTYKALGFNTCIMTEDYVGMVKDGGLNPDYKAAVEKLGEHGLDVWIRNQYNDEDFFVNDQPDKKRSNYGAPYSLSERNITTEFQDIDCVKGFYMADEPYMTTADAEKDAPGENYAAMDRYQKLVDWKNQYYPDALWHLNQVPSSSINHFPETNYESFLQYYVDHILKKLTSGPRTLSLDRYPLCSDTSLDQDYFSDILVGAYVNKKYNDSVDEASRSTYCICLQTFMNTSPLAHLIDITCPEEITFQIYSGYAVGIQAFEYFCYRSLGGLGMYGIIDDEGEKRIYDHVMEANRRALWMQDVLLDFSWQGAFTSSAFEENMRQNEACFETAVPYVIKEEDRGVLKSVNSRLDTVIGCYKKGQQDGYMVTNYTHPLLEQTDVVTMDFTDCTKAIVYQSGKPNVVNLVDGKLRLKLAQGDGAFVIPK